MTQKTNLKTSRGSPNISSNRRPCSLEWVRETGLGKGRGVSWIFSLQRTKQCVERSRHLPGHWAHGHSDWMLSLALGALHCLHPWHRLSSSHISWRLRSHDLDLANWGVLSSLATVIGSGPVQWPVRAQGRAPNWNQREKDSAFCQKGWGRVTSGYSSGRGMRSAWGRWWPSCSHQARAAHLRMRTLLSQGLRAPVPAMVPELHLRPEGSRLPVSPLLLVCSFFEPRWVFCPAG